MCAYTYTYTSARDVGYMRMLINKMLYSARCLSLAGDISKRGLSGNEDIHAHTHGIAQPPVTQKHWIPIQTFLFIRVTPLLLHVLSLGKKRVARGVIERDMTSQQRQFSGYDLGQRSGTQTKNISSHRIYNLTQKNWHENLFTSRMHLSLDQTAINAL